MRRCHERVELSRGILAIVDRAELSATESGFPRGTFFPKRHPSLDERSVRATPCPCLPCVRARNLCVCVCVCLSSRDSKTRLPSLLAKRDKCGGTEIGRGNDGDRVRQTGGTRKARENERRVSSESEEHGVGRRVTTCQTSSYSHISERPSHRPPLPLYSALFWTGMSPRDLLSPRQNTEKVLR